MLRRVQRETDDDFGMFGDDPDPTVMTARVGSGKFRTRMQRGLGGHDQEGSENPIGLKR